MLFQGNGHLLRSPEYWWLALDGSVLSPPSAQPLDSSLTTSSRREMLILPDMAMRRMGLRQLPKPSFVIDQPAVATDRATARSAIVRPSTNIPPTRAPWPARCSHTVGRATPSLSAPVFREGGRARRVARSGLNELLRGPSWLSVALLSRRRSPDSGP